MNTQLLIRHLDKYKQWKAGNTTQYEEERRE